VPPPLPLQAQAAVQTVQTIKSRADATTVRPPHSRTERGRWFLLGLVAGAIVAVVARGEGPATLRDLREWSARTLRSLEHHSERRPQSETSALAPVLAVEQAPAPGRPARTSDAPCPVNPGPEDPCAELLAPFLTKTTAALDVPTFPVETLPRVKPVVAARRHHARPAPVAVAPRVDDGADNDADAAQSTTPPAPPRRDDAIAPERIPIVAPEQTAENELR
jgi:hypothetical protein